MGMTVGTRTILQETVVILVIVNLSHYDPTSLTVAAASSVLQMTADVLAQV